MLRVFLAFLLAARVVAQNGPKTWTAAPFNPPSFPLAVKSPYVNVWAPQGNGPAELSQAWPRVWADLSIIGWYASVRVDGTAYMLLGAQGTPLLSSANQTTVQLTPTRTSYILNAGPVTVNATFLSPIEATDLVRQSLPFSYFYLSVQSSDGQSHDVQLYSDVSGEWITGDSNLQANWTANGDSNIVYLQMQLASPNAYQEIDSRPQDATLYYSMKNSNGVSWQIGPANDIRSFFANGTGLNEKSDTAFHAVNNPFDTLGIAVNLGNITAATDLVVYAVGVVRDPVIRYTNAKVQIEQRSAYYWSQFSDIQDVIENVLDDFDNALGAAVALDAQILGDGGKISSNYADLLALATRQAMSAFEYTLVKNSSGTFNMSDVKAFMKDMGSVGSGGPSAQYQNPYAAQDLGSGFPNAPGNFQEHHQEIEQSANMLIMSLAHAQFSGDGTLLGQHYDLLNSWASFLVSNSMAPGDETTSSSDGISATNQTNLALKGILGISAMAKISGFAGRSDDQTHYQSISTQYAQQWTSLASASGHLASSYGSASSGIMYNLFADKLLQLNLINSSVYNLQTSYCETQASANSYGIPWTAVRVLDWTMFAAATVTDTSVRDSLISLLHAYASPNFENLPFAVMYNPTTGHQIGGINSPAQGAMFAPLSLNVATKPVSFTGPTESNTATTSTSKGGKKTGLIAGTTVGALALIGLAAGVFVLCRRREQRLKGSYIVQTTAYTPDSVLESLSATVHPDMHDMRSPSTTRRYLSSEGLGMGENTAGRITPYNVLVPSAVQHARKRDIYAGGDTASNVVPRDGSSNVSTQLVSTEGGSAVNAGLTPVPHSRTEQHGLRSEVDNLRREIEQMRGERSVVSEAPPSYDADRSNSLRNMGPP
ncbi:DUF1793-domain-containing protein [Phellopilus nigrolimitatus]|nr:DUF1793-domain-containing protein [Phellopilus nigrolimitatus]